MINAIAFFLTILYLSARLRRQFTDILPIITLAGMLLLSSLAMVGHLAWIDCCSAVLCVALVALLLFDLLRSQKSAKALWRGFCQYSLTSGLLLFILLAAFFWFAAEPMTVWWRDDLAHWGLNVKSLWYSDGLVSGSQHLNERFGDYPPGVQVLTWLVMHIQGAWSEQALYFTLFTTYAVFLLPLFRSLTWKWFYLLPLVFILCIAIPTWGNVLSFVFLGIDTTLSLCFGYVLVLVWRHKQGDWFDLLAIALGLCGLFLIKQIGLLLAVFAILLLALRKSEKPLSLFAATLPVFAVTAAWFLYCRFMGLSGYNATGAFSKVLALLHGTYIPPENAALVLPTLLQSLNTKYVGEIVQHTAPLLILPPSVWLVGLPLLPLFFGCCQRSGKSMLLITLSLLSTSLVYIAVIYLSFFTTFYYETNVYTGRFADNMVILIERYMAPVIIGNAMLVLAILLDALHNASERKQKSKPIILLALLTSLILLGTNWVLLGKVLNPDQYYQGEHAIGSEATVRDQESWGSARDEATDARVLIDLDSTSDYIKEIVYSFAPAKFFLQTPESTASPEALAQYIQAQHITHLVCLQEDSLLAQAVTPLIGEDWFYTYTLYSITLEDSELVFTEE